MFGMGDQTRSPFAARQRVVMLAVHDQRRAAVGGQLGCQIGHCQRVEHMGNAFRIERAAALDEACQQITPDGTVGPCLRHAVAKVPEMIVLQRAGGVMCRDRRRCGDRTAAAVRCCRRQERPPGISRDESQASMSAIFEPMLQPSTTAPPATSFIGKDAEDVVAHVAQRERRAWLCGAPPATQVHRDRAEGRRKGFHLIEPQIVIEGQRMDQHERRAASPLSRSRCPAHWPG